MEETVRVTGFDHLVLRVADVEKALAWYQHVLGLEGVRIDDWRQGEAPFPSVRVNDHTIIDFVPADGAPTAAGSRAANVDHLCLVVEATDLAAFAARSDVDAMTEPMLLYGARGVGTSIYVRDPDGNTVELRHY